MEILSIEEIIEIFSPVLVHCSVQKGCCSHSNLHLRRKDKFFALLETILKKVNLFSNIYHPLPYDG